MDGVKRYGFKYDGMFEMDALGGWVKASDFDAALADANDAERREAALREELADETRRANVNALNARHAKQDLNTIQHRLTAAEQRNADVIELLRDLRDFVDLSAWGHRIDAALKPTESGASE